MTTHSLATIVLVAVIAVLSPPLADVAARRAPVPLVVFEIVLGILVGPDVLGWAHDDDYVHALSQFGLAMLFFMAGYEIDFARLRGGPLNRALLGWAMSVVEAIGFGFLIPVFFIDTGIGYDLKALTSNWATLGLVPLFLAMFLLTRGLPSFLTAPEGTTARARRAIALYAATGLPLIVAITSIGVERGTLRASTAAAMVGAGMLSVLLYPFLALKVSGETRISQGLEEAAESW